MSEDKLNDLIDDIHERYSDYLLAIAKRAFYSEEDANDVVQETFFRVCKYKHKLPEIENIKAWLDTIINSVICQKIKDNTKNKYVPLDALSDKNLSSTNNYSPNKKVENREFMDHLSEALNKLKNPKQKKAWVLKYINNLSTKEIASQTGKSEEMIRRWNRKTQKYLKEFLEKKGYGI